MIYPFHSFINSQTWCKRITNNYCLSNFDSLPSLNSSCCNVNLLYYIFVIIWSQMLNHFGIEAFVGGNLGNPLSEAAFLCLSPSMKPRFQVSLIVRIISPSTQIYLKCHFTSIYLRISLSFEVKVNFNGSYLFQVAVVEVSSYQMEIPNKYFCPSVSRFEILTVQVSFISPLPLFVCLLIYGHLCRLLLC